jgi:hypothetical protein
MFMEAINDPVISVWNLNDYSLRKEILSPGDYRLKIKINENYDILGIGNPFQINFYSV